MTDPASQSLQPPYESIDQFIPVQQTHEVAAFKHAVALTTVRADPAQRFVAAGAEDNEVQLWEIATGKQHTLTGHRSWVRSIDFSHDGSRMFTACWGGEVKIWDLNTDAPTAIRTIKAHHGSARFVRVSPDGKRLATCGNDRLVKIWNISNGGQVRQFTGHARHVYGVDFHPHEEYVVSQDLMGDIRVWDLTKGKLHREVDGSVMTGYDNKFAADMGGARDMEFSPSGDQWASAGITNVSNSFAGIQDPIIVIFDWATGAPVQKIKSSDSGAKGIAWGVRYHSAGFYIGGIADRSGKGVIWFCDPNHAHPFHEMKLPSAARGLDLLSDQQRLAIGHADGHVRLYSMTEKPADTAAQKA